MDYQLREISYDELDYISKLSNGGIRFLISRIPDTSLLIDAYKFVYPYIQHLLMQNIDEYDNITDTCILINELFKLGSIVPKLIYIVFKHMVGNGIIEERLTEDSIFMDNNKIDEFMYGAIKKMVNDRNLPLKEDKRFIPIFIGEYYDFYITNDIHDKNVYFSPKFFSFKEKEGKIVLPKEEDIKIAIGSPQYNGYLEFVNQYVDDLYNGQDLLDELKRDSKPILCSYGNELRNLFKIEPFF